MPLTEEIREYFAGLRKGKAAQLSIPDPHSAWAIRMQEWYGVAIDCGDIAPVSLNFSNSSLKTTSLEIGGILRNVLVLNTSIEDFRNEFAAVCAQFVNPGNNGEQRKALLENPTKWWDRWRSLLGNSIADTTAYSTLGELLAYELLIKAGRQPEWGGANGATHDIETLGADYEVKSTTDRYGVQITLSSQFQMMGHEKDLYVLFFRFETALEGDSVDSVASRLVALGVDELQLETRLKRLGLEKGSYSRNDKFHCLEMRKYTVNESFPAITAKSFIGEKYPEALVKFNYTVSLDGLDYLTTV